ncbi:MAG: exodeoxyribonuclease VII small subunit [Clostridiales bacterium]|nr:exodeoxyribonuclease VII small subunit [Clostridiales bacterium]
METKHTYETAVKRLEEIVALLENGEASLDESMKLFEEGVALADFCGKKLAAAKQKITQLRPEQG